MKTTNKTTWHTAKSAAAHAQVSLWTIRHAVQEGDLAAYALRGGREYRIKESEIDAWMESTPYEPVRLT